MNCEKYGAEKVEGQCPNCKAPNQIVSIAYNVYVFVVTIALLLIIRLMNQATSMVTQSSYSMEYYVPGAIQGIMFFLLGLSVFVLFKMYRNKMYSKKQTMLLMITEIIVGLLIIFIKFR